MFMSDLPYFASILLTRVKFTCVRTEKLHNSGNPPLSGKFRCVGSVLLYGRWLHMEVPVYQYNLSRSHDGTVLFFLHLYFALFSFLFTSNNVYHGQSFNATIHHNSFNSNASPK